MARTKKGEKMTDTIYVMGAGTSVFAGAPTMKNFMTIANSHGYIGNKLKKFLSSFYKIRFGKNSIFPNIEEILGIIEFILNNQDILIDKSKKNCIFEPEFIETLKFELDYLIATTLEKTLRNVENNYMKTFVEKIIPDKNNPNVAFISLNYDILLDNSLLRYVSHDASNNTISIPIDYGCNIKWCKFTDIESRLVCPSNSIKLFKPHGSLNMLFCKACKNLYLTIHQKGYFNTFEENFPCPEDKVNLDGFIVPPTFFKQFNKIHLESIWMNIEETISKCKKIIFLGYSLPDADVYFKYKIKKALMRNKNNPSIEVYTGDGNGEEERYKATFGKIKFKNMHFEDYVSQL